jgi:hypothetical protein
MPITLEEGRSRSRRVENNSDPDGNTTDRKNASVHFRVLPAPIPFMRGAVLRTSQSKSKMKQPMHFGMGCFAYGFLVGILGAKDCLPRPGECA